MGNITNPIQKSNSGLKKYSNKNTYSTETYELRNIFQNECIIIPYTLYYQKIKEHLPARYIKILEDYKQLTYDINTYKRNTSKCYDKNLVSYLKKLYKYQDNPTKLFTETHDKNGKILKQYKAFIEPTPKEYNEYKEFIVKDWKNHPVYTGAKQYYDNLEKRKAIKDIYTKLDAKILEKCKELWFRNYEKNHKYINTVARDRFWELARGLVINTINQLYTIDIPENLPEIIDETLGRVYEGLMCFYDPNYRIDTFIYSITMSKISAYERARLKKEDAPELFHNMDDTEMIHTYYGFSNPKLPPILEASDSVFIQRHNSWLRTIEELVTHG